jgi:uncharacterized protein YjbJ (UPF0337 family)
VPHDRAKVTNRTKTDATRAVRTPDTAPGSRAGQRDLLRYPTTFSPRSYVMNWDQITGDWKQFKGKVKEKWGKLTDDELTTVAGKREHLAGLLQERYGYAKEQAEKELNEFSQKLNL